MPLCKSPSSLFNDETSFRETPIQERLKIETAKFSIIARLNSNRPFSNKPNDKPSETIGFVRENHKIVEVTSVINGHKCNKETSVIRFGHKCNKVH